MKKIPLFGTFVFQLLLTYGVLFGIYMIFAILDSDEADLINELALLIIHPLYAFLLSSAAIFCCALIGLPIRLIAAIRVWWTSRPILVLVGTLTASALLLLSLTSTFADHRTILIAGEQKTKQIPNLYLVATGWFLMAFCLLHFYPLPLIYSIKRRWFSGAR